MSFSSVEQINSTQQFHSFSLGAFHYMLNNLGEAFNSLT